MNIRYFLIILFFLFTTGCATTQQNNNAPKHSLFFPAPPEEARLQFVTSFSSSKDIEQKSNAFTEFVVGKEEENVKKMLKPYGARIKNGKIYVCDTVQAGVIMIDLVKRSYKLFQPMGRDALIDPINVDIDSNDQMYVADARRGQVVIYSKDGQALSTIGEKGDFKPTDVVIKNKKLYICDIKSQKVKVYDLETKNLLYTIPQDNTDKNGSLYSPTNLAIDREDNVYVSDLGSFDVKKYDSTGRWISTIGTLGDAPGTFARPKGVAVDNDGNLYVVDAAFNSVQIFNKEGKLMLFFPEQKDELQLVLPAGISVDYDNLQYFKSMIDENFDAKYLVFVVSQYGDRKINVFAFGKKIAG